MKKVKGVPITGAKPQYSKKQPFVPDAKETSQDAQTFIGQAPMPFKDKNSLGELPPGGGTGASGGVSTLEPRIASGLKRTTPRVRALPPNAPIGQRTPINQSGQIGGKLGFPPPKRRAGNNGSGYPSRRNASFYGE